MLQPETAAGEAQAAIGRVDFLNGAARRDLRMVDHFLDLPDAGAGRAGGIEDLFPLARILAASASSMMARSAGSFSCRANQSVKRGSSSTSARPSAVISARYCFSLFTASSR